GHERESDVHQYLTRTGPRRGHFCDQRLTGADVLDELLHVTYPSMKVCIHYSSVSSCQICQDQSSRPARCSPISLRTAAGRNKSLRRIRSSPKRSSTISRKSFASQ